MRYRKRVFLAWLNVGVRCSDSSLAHRIQRIEISHLLRLTAVRGDRRCNRRRAGRKSCRHEVRTFLHCLRINSHRTFSRLNQRGWITRLAHYARNQNRARSHFLTGVVCSDQVHFGDDNSQQGATDSGRAPAGPRRHLQDFSLGYPGINVISRIAVNPWPPFKPDSWDSLLWACTLVGSVWNEVEEMEQTTLCCVVDNDADAPSIASHTIQIQSSSAWSTAADVVVVAAAVWAALHFKEAWSN